MLAHKPQLDSLRAIAVLAVLLGHFAYVPVAQEGVQLFFVLSGFLITRILIEGRSQFEHLSFSPRIFLLRQFYVRRFLRIFPPYYTLLFVLALITLASPSGTVRGSSVAFWQSIWFHVTYTSNFWFAFTGKWDPWITSHFWSLAVEEQFYLFWPWIILCVHKKYLWIAAILLSLLGPAFRAIMVSYNTGHITGGTLTPTYFDFLGLGGLVATVWEQPKAQSAIRTAGGITAVLLGVSLVFGLTMPQAMTLWAVSFAAFVSKAAEGFAGPVGYLLNLQPARYIGRISYGIYLYHLPVLVLSRLTAEKAGRQLNVGFKLFAIAGVISVLVAAVSWHFLEGPINSLKRFFPYQARVSQREDLEVAVC